MLWGEVRDVKEDDQHGDVRLRLRLLWRVSGNHAQCNHIFHELLYNRSWVNNETGR